MLKKTVLLDLAVAAVATPLSPTVNAADAQEYYGGGWRDHRGWDDRGWDGPRPDWRRHHHHHDYGGAIAGGLAAGLIGGIVAGSIDNGGPRYYARQCWYERRTVQDQYDDGYHLERVRVCN